MAKQVFALIILSILSVILVHQVAWFLHVLANIHDFIYTNLGLIFSGDFIARLLQSTIALLALPLLLIATVGGIHWAIRRNQAAYLPTVMWAAWIILLVLFVLNGVDGASANAGFGTGPVIS